MSKGMNVEEFERKLIEEIKRKNVENLDNQLNPNNSIPIKSKNKVRFGKTNTKNHKLKKTNKRKNKPNPKRKLNTAKTMKDNQLDEKNSRPTSIKKMEKLVRKVIKFLLRDFMIKTLKSTQLWYQDPTRGKR